MSKLSKLIKTPRLYFKDAIIKNILKNNNIYVKGNANKINTSTIKTSTTKIKPKVDITKTKINLVIIDDVLEKISLKSKILKYQYRSIEKYSNFNSISYISQNILSSNNSIQVFKDYNTFYEKKVASEPLKNEYYIFINLNFFFLKKVDISKFVKEDGQLVTYIKKNKNKKLNIDSHISKYLDGFNFNFTPMENFNISNKMHLLYLNDLGELSETKYFFHFLPIMGALLSNNFVTESPIQYARLDYGYIEKFVWIQSVHGSNRCPPAVTFDHLTSNEAHYLDFLDSLLPHSSLLENEISVF